MNITQYLKWVIAIIMYLNLKVILTFKVLEVQNTNMNAVAKSSISTKS